MFNIYAIISLKNKINNRYKIVTIYKNNYNKNN